MSSVGGIRTVLIPDVTIGRPETPPTGRRSGHRYAGRPARQPGLASRPGDARLRTTASINRRGRRPLRQLQRTHQHLCRRGCPVRFRCVGCSHFSTDVSYLPDLDSYPADLLRSRERLRSAFDAADEWARAESMPSDEGITRIRGLISSAQEVTAAIENCDAVGGISIAPEALTVQPPRPRAPSTPPCPQPRCRTRRDRPTPTLYR